MSELYIGEDRATGMLKHITEVPRGLDCQCNCPECGGELIAKKGDIMKHHFAHSIEGSYHCMGTSPAMTFIHKKASQVWREHATEQRSMRYKGSLLTSDACGVFPELGYAHIEVVVTSRLKDDKLEYIKQQFDDPARVIRCDLSRPEEREEFMRLFEVNPNGLIPFMLEQCVGIDTYYQLRERLVERVTVAAKFPDLDRGTQIKIGQVASAWQRGHKIEQIKIREGSYRVNAFHHSTLEDAYDIVMDEEEYRSFKRTWGY